MMNNTKPEVWVVDDDQSIRWVLERTLGGSGMRVHTFSDGIQVIRALENRHPDVLITDIRMPKCSGIELLQKIHQIDESFPVIVTTAYSDLDSAVASYEGGAFEYLPKPFDIDEAIHLVERAYRFKKEPKTTTPESGHSAQLTSPGLIGAAPAMQEVFRAIGRLSRSSITVLLTGESGTGKELVARALHHHSPRSKRPFIALNCAAIPRDLLESELFGHERGSFTGAQALRRGRFEQADGGTLFLDEIGDMPAELQTRLLRVLSDGHFYRVGGQTPLRANVRVIAATHQNLEKSVQENDFREDLFHRLNVIRIRIPPLRERCEDIPLLLNYFLDRAAHELEVEQKTLQPEVETYLSCLPWPGNVRQLENLCRWLTVMASGHEVHMVDLPPDAGDSHIAPTITTDGDWEQALRLWAFQAIANGEESIATRATSRMEKIMIEAALQHAGGKRLVAARLLGWGRNTLTRKLQEYEVGDETE